jgi:hypothetical protein
MKATTHRTLSIDPQGRIYELPGLSDYAQPQAIPFPVETKFQLVGQLDPMPVLNTGYSYGDITVSTQFGKVGVIPLASGFQSAQTPYGG